MTLNWGIFCLDSSFKVDDIALFESTIDTLQKVYIMELSKPLEEDSSATTFADNDWNSIKVIY